MGERAVVISIILFNVILFALISAIIIFIREYRIKKRTHLKELETVDILHKKELLKTQTEIQKETMKYIGREIHDNVGQKLTLTSLYLQQLAFENKVPQVSESINTINTIIDESLNELRHLSKSLTDDTIENNSIIELIKEECKRISDFKKYHIAYKKNSENFPVSYQIKSVLLRITQEFFQNSIKHAECENIVVSLNKIQSNIVLTLQDDGKGFDVEHLKPNGIGLKNIIKRTELIGGECSIESQPNKGTLVTIEIPI